MSLLRLLRYTHKFPSLGDKLSLIKSAWQHQSIRQKSNVQHTAPPWLELSAEVANALSEGRPVVALESTIVTHGMPAPQNVQTAEAVETIVRSRGAVPATVGVIRGKVTVGLSKQELEWLASADCKPSKVSRRDMAFLIAQGLSGGTTVAGTMLAAHAAGISVFVTGGVGGVHREAESTLDVSADLAELGRTPVAVVSAGVKSILDIPRTLEYLETEGVGVFTYAPTTDFPAFFTPRSGSHAPHCLQTPLQAATVIDTTLTFDPPSGVLIAVPIPESEALDEQEVEVAIATATAEAKSKNVSGKSLTPFLLQRVNELMEGKSLTANIALIKNNAAVGSQIAGALASLRNRRTGKVGMTWRRSGYTASVPQTWKKRDAEPKGDRIVVVGGTNVDFTARFGQEKVVPNGATYPGSVRQSFGGVGRNLADGLARLRQNPVFLSALGQDSYLQLLKAECGHMDLHSVRALTSHPSATYCAILDARGDLVYGVGDFSVHERITPKYISLFEEEISKAPMVIFDGNIPAETMSHITNLCRQYGIPAFFEPTDVRLVRRLFASDAWRHVTYTSPNMNELRVLNAGVTSGELEPPSNGSMVDGTLSDTLDEVLSLAKDVVEHIPNLLVTAGHYGAVLCRNTDVDTPLPHGSKGVREIKVGGSMSALYVPAKVQDPESIISVSGAGDCLVAGFVTALLHDASPASCLAQGIVGAEVSLGSNMAVPEQLSAHVIAERAGNHEVSVIYPVNKK